MGGGAAIARFSSARPPDNADAGRDLLAAIRWRGPVPRTVLTGSCAFSKRMEASVRSLMAEEVLRTEAAWKLALSRTTRVVLSLMAVSAPPMTPASAMAPAASAITRLAGPRVYSSSFRARKRSPGCAGRTKMVSPRSRSASKACIGWAISAITIVRHVDDIVDRVQADGGKAALQPQRRRPDGDVFEDQRAVPRAEIQVFDVDADRRRAGRQQAQAGRGPSGGGPESRRLRGPCRGGPTGRGGG